MHTGIRDLSSWQWGAIYCYEYGNDQNWGLLSRSISGEFLAYDSIEGFISGDDLPGSQNSTSICNANFDWFQTGASLSYYRAFLWNSNETHEPVIDYSLTNDF